MRTLLFLALAISYFGYACKKVEPTTNSSETEELTALLDSYAGNYTLKVRREVTDSSGATIVTNFADTSVAITRPDTNSLECLGYTLIFNRLNNETPVFLMPATYVLTNPNNTPNSNQSLNLYHQADSIQFINSSGGHLNHTVWIYSGQKHL